MFFSSILADAVRCATTDSVPLSLVTKDDPRFFMYLAHFKNPVTFSAYPKYPLHVVDKSSVSCMISKYFLLSCDSVDCLFNVLKSVSMCMCAECLALNK